MPHDACAYNLEILVAKLSEAKQTFAANPQKVRDQALIACVDFLDKTFPELGKTDLLRPLRGLAVDLATQLHGGAFHIRKDQEKGLTLYLVRHLQRKYQLRLREATEYVSKAFRHHGVEKNAASIRHLVNEINKTEAKVSQMPEDVCAQLDEEMRRRFPLPNEWSPEQTASHVIGIVGLERFP